MKPDVLDAITWAGFAIDTVTNLGGILPRAALLLTWPPVAALLAVRSERRRSDSPDHRGLPNCA